MPHKRTASQWNLSVNGERIRYAAAARLPMQPRELRVCAGIRVIVMTSMIVRSIPLRDAARSIVTQMISFGIMARNAILTRGTLVKIHKFVFIGI